MDKRSVEERLRQLEIKTQYQLTEEETEWLDKSKYDGWRESEPSDFFILVARHLIEDLFQGEESISRSEFAEALRENSDFYVAMRVLSKIQDCDW